MDKLVDDCKDIFSVIPGPDVGIATNDHEDIENSDNESEMIETVLIEASANKMQHMVWIKNGWFSQIRREMPFRVYKL